LFIEWFRATAMAGTPAHARELIAKAQSAGKLRELVMRVSAQTEAELASRDLCAEAAYVLGNFYSADNRTDQANAAYELALEYDPTHPWACNNLGYSLLERGGDLERAGALLERAHATLPGEAAITDSLGWLRYKQDMLFDERAPDGSVGKRGAVSLLQAAADTERGPARSNDSGSPRRCPVAGGPFAGCSPVLGTDREGGNAAAGPECKSARRRGRAARTADRGR
jgi:tetratricopeptide (TPR) repeat protein